jgi:hypothetical protein
MTMRSGTLWRTAYSVDLTAQANLNIRTGGNGTKTIDGKVWTWRNDGNLATANVVNGGDGIVMVASATNTGYYEGSNANTAPCLTLPITTAFPSFVFGQNAIRVLARIKLTNADASAEGGKLFIEDATTPQNQNVAIAKQYSGGLGFQVNDSLDPTYITQYAFNTAVSTDDILCLVLIPGKMWQAYTGTYVAGEKMRLSTFRTSFAQNTGTPAFKTPANIRIGLCQTTNNTAGTLTTAFTHLRVDFCDLLPTI